MKKVIGVALVLCIFLLSASCAQPIKPGIIAINNAVAWAESLEGKDAFPYSNGWGLCPSYMGCGMFVANAYGFECTAGSAYILWQSMDQHPGDWDAPRGSLVFFEYNENNMGLGHVALSLGNGNIIQAGYPVIATGTLKAENTHNAYLGWAWPPQEWPGRSGGFAWTLILIALTVVLIVGSGIWFLLLKPKGKAALLPVDRNKEQP